MVLGKRLIGNQDLVEAGDHTRERGSTPHLLSPPYSVLWSSLFRTLQSGGAHQIATSLRGSNVVDDHVTDQQVAVGAADQTVAELQSDDLRKMLVLRDRPNLRLAQLAEPKAVVERQHRRLPPRTCVPSQAGTGGRQGH